MLFIYIISILSLYTLNYNKPQTVEVSPVVETVETNVPAKSSRQKLQQENILVEENEISSEENINSEEIPNSEEIEDNDELYEEIIFNDDFDKEYRSWTEDNYLDD